jgi:hypothetical protein
LFLFLLLIVVLLLDFLLFFIIPWLVRLHTTLAWLSHHQLSTILDIVVLESFAEVINNLACLFVYQNMLPLKEGFEEVNLGLQNINEISRLNENITLVSLSFTLNLNEDLLSHHNINRCSFLQELSFLYAQLVISHFISVQVDLNGHLVLDT